MRDFLLELAALALGSSLAIVLLILAGRLLGGRYGIRWRCWAWLILCLRLALPFPLLPRQTAPIQVTVPTVSLPAPSPAGSSPSVPDPIPVPPAGSSPESPGDEEEAQTPAAPAPIAWESILFFLWLAGAAAVLGWGLLSHGRFLRWLRRWAAPETGPEVLALCARLSGELGLKRPPALFRCPELRAPMLAGLVRPAVLLPQAAPEGEALEYALLHELTHLRRRDVWRKALALWVNALYWFNPLIWLMVRLADRDGELACDETVLRRLPPEARPRYGRAVWEAVERVSRPD